MQSASRLHPAESNRHSSTSKPRKNIEFNNEDFFRYFLQCLKEGIHFGAFGHYCAVTYQSCGCQIGGGGGVRVVPSLFSGLQMSGNGNLTDIKLKMVERKKYSAQDVQTFGSVNEILKTGCQTKAVRQYFPMLLLIILYKVVVTFGSESGEIVNPLSPSSDRHLIYSNNTTT